LSVPGDISVVGFDDLPMSAWTHPALTTVHQPIIEKGRIAARLLIQRMEGRAVESPAPLVTSLVIRDSTSARKEVVVGRHI
jgi:LacI family transcriptional regulator